MISIMEIIEVEEICTRASNRVCIDLNYLVEFAVIT